VKEDAALGATVSADPTVASAAAPPVGSARELPEVPDDRYAIGAEVGRGGIGRVVKARDEVLERQVALKQLFATDEGSRRRFIREALITARLQHPSIVPVYDAGRREDRSPFYAMKLVAGQPLEREIAAATTLERRLALVPTVLAVADAIAYAHNERIIHRDLKPANVLVGKFGETVVIDWGLAKDLSIDDREALPVGPYRSLAHEAETVAGSVMGTPGYMAPEQASGEDADERADVYAIGAVLYHVIAGVLPHQGTTIDDVIAKVIRGDIRPLLEREPRTPPDLAAIVGKAMAVDKAARYRNAGELADDLRKYQTGKLVGAHHYTRGARVKRWIKRNRAIALVSLIATILLVVGAAVSIQRILAARDTANRERDEAVAKSNRAHLNQARALRQEPARLLATLANLDESGPGWEAARMLAADALAQPRLLAQTRGPASRSTRGFSPSSELELSRDGTRAFAFDQSGLWIMDLVAMKTTLLRYGNDPLAIRRLEVCDDAEHAYLLSDNSLRPVLHRADLTTKLVTPVEGGAAAFVEAVAKCDGDFALVANETGLRWSDPTGRAPTTFSTVPMEAAWFTPDRQHVVALDRGGGLRRFDRSGKELDVLPGSGPPTYPEIDRLLRRSSAKAALSRDGSTAVTFAHGSYRFWSFAFGRSVVPKLAKDIEGVVVAPDGAVAYLSTPTGGYEIVASADPFDTVMPSVPRGMLAMSPDGAWLVGVEGGKVRFTDRAVVVERELRGHAGAERIAFTEKGQLVTVGGDAIRLWDLGTPGRSHGRVGVHAAGFSPDGRWLAIDNGKSLARWDVAADKLVDEVAHDRAASDVSSIAIANTGDVVFTLQDGVFRWPRSSGLQRLGTHPYATTLSSGFLPDRTAITVSVDRVMVWRAAGPQEIKLPRQQAARRPDTFSFALDERGTRALVDCRPVGEAIRTCVVDLEQGRVRLLPNTSGMAAITPNGQLAITGLDDDKCAIWDLERLAMINVLASVGAVTEIGISPDGTQGIIGGLGGVDRIELDTLRVIPLGSSERATGRRLQWSPDSKTVVGADLVMRDVATGELRELACPWCEAWHLSETALTVLTRWGIFRVADDLPRDPVALKRILTALPYELDDHGAVIVNASR
jgi:WD40 repeat protein/tRNA A-37 threonylcarbamoyl transferase component Bud32